MLPRPADSSLERSLESRRLQEHLGERSYESKLNSSRSEAKFTLEDQQIQKAVSNRQQESYWSNKSLQSGQDESYWSNKRLLSGQQENLWREKRLENSRQQGQWLEESSLDKKTAQARQDSDNQRFDNNRPISSDIRQAPAHSNSEAQNAKQLANKQMAGDPAGNKTPTLNNSFNSQISAENKIQQKMSEFNNPTQISLKLADKQEAMYWGDGIRNATKETTAMPAFFNTQYNSAHDQGKGWRQPAEDQATNNELAASTTRRSAIVEAPRADSYKETAVRETLMPRLQELVNRLSSMGHTWARVVVPVDSRTQVIVRFNNQSGRIKIHLSAPNNELCEMIKASWGALAGDAAQRGVTLEEPTFDNNHD